MLTGGSPGKAPNGRILGKFKGSSIPPCAASSGAFWLRLEFVEASLESPSHSGWPERAGKEDAQGPHSPDAFSAPLVAVGEVVGKSRRFWG